MTKLLLQPSNDKLSVKCITGHKGQNSFNQAELSVSDANDNK